MYKDSAHGVANAGLSSASVASSDLIAPRHGHAVEDAATALCAYLIVHEKLTCKRIAAELGVPVLVVVGCLHSGESSRLFRVLLWRWFGSLSPASGHAGAGDAEHAQGATDEQTSRPHTDLSHRSVHTGTYLPGHAASLYDRLPRRWLQALRESVLADEQQCGTTSLQALHEWNETGAGSLTSVLDARSRAHFATLQSTVGQQFISILNNASGPVADRSAWGSWLGEKLYEAFDYRGEGAPTMGATAGYVDHHRPNSNNGYTSNTTMHTSSGNNYPSSSGNTNAVDHAHDGGSLGPDSATLLARQAIRANFTDYVRLLSAAYYTNRKEGGAGNSVLDWQQQQYFPDVGSPDEALLHRSELATHAARARLEGHADSDVSAAKVGSGAAMRDDETLAWPRGVPDEFYVKQYDSERAEMVRLSPSATVQRTLNHTPPPNATVAVKAPTRFSINKAPSRDEEMHTHPNDEDATRMTAEGIEDAFRDDLAVLEQRITALRRWEGAVEECLLAHVQRRSDDFYAVTRRYGMLGSDAQAALAAVRHIRAHDLRDSQARVCATLDIVARHRRREHCAVFVAVLQRAQSIVRAVTKVENWVTLPERDLTELSVYVTRLVQLRRFLYEDSDAVSPEDALRQSTTTTTISSSTSSSSSATLTATVSSPTVQTHAHFSSSSLPPDCFSALSTAKLLRWRALSKLPCMSNMEQRVRTAQQRIEPWVRAHVVSLLASADGDVWSDRRNMDTGHNIHYGNSNTDTHVRPRSSTVAAAATTPGNEHVSDGITSSDANSCSIRHTDATSRDGMVATPKIVVPPLSSSVLMLVAALQLNIVSLSLDDYAVVASREMWSSARELVTEYLVSHANLNDSQANALLTLHTAASPTLQERRAVFGFCRGCRFLIFVPLVAHMTELLVARVTQTVQQWGYFVLCGLPCAMRLFRRTIPPLTAGRGKEEEEEEQQVCQLTREVTFKFFDTLLTEAEGTLSLLMLEACGEAGVPEEPSSVSSASSASTKTMITRTRTELEMLVQMGNDAVEALRQPLRDLEYIYRTQQTDRPASRRYGSPGSNTDNDIVASRRDKCNSTSADATVHLSSHGNMANNDSNRTHAHERTGANDDDEPGKNHVCSHALSGLARYAARGTHIQLSVQRVARIFIRVYHRQRMPWLRDVLAREPWTAVTSIAMRHQRRVDRLVQYDDASLARFRRRTLELVTALSVSPMCCTSRGRSSDGRSSSSNHAAAASTKSHDGDQDDCASWMRGRRTVLLVSDEATDGPNALTSLPSSRNARRSAMMSSRSDTKCTRHVWHSGAGAALAVHGADTSAHAMATSGRARNESDDEDAEESVGEMEEMGGGGGGGGGVDTSVTAQKLYVMYPVPSSQPHRAEDDSTDATHTKAREDGSQTETPTLLLHDEHSREASCVRTTHKDGNEDRVSCTGRNGNAKTATNHSECDTVEVCHEGRVVTASLLALVEMLADYDAILARFPSLAFDVIRRQCELLEQFDAEMAQLVLGASAVGRGTLRTITTVHLSMVAQCVGFIADMVPPFRSRLHCLFCCDASDTNTAATATTAAAKMHAANTDSNTTKSNASSSSSTSGATDAVVRNRLWGHSSPSCSAPNLRPFIDESLARVLYNCRAHQRDCFRKIAALVETKVDSLGVGESVGPAMPTHDQWPARGNEWVMTMLREVARLLRTLRPLMPAVEVAAVVGPLLTRLGGRIRRLTRAIRYPGSDAHRAALADVRLFTANVEKFGYDVRRGVTLSGAGAKEVKRASQSENEGPREGGSVENDSAEEELLRWFFPLLPAASVYAGGSEPSAADPHSPSLTVERTSVMRPRSPPSRSTSSGRTDS